MQCNSPASPVRRGGGRGRDGTLGNSRKGVKGGMRSQTPPPLLQGGEGVRGRDGTLGRKCYPDLSGQQKKVVPLARVRRRPRLLKIILLRLDKSQLPPKNEAVIPS